MAAFFENQLTFPAYLKVFFYVVLLFNLISSIFIINKKYIPLYLLLIITLLFAPRILEIINPNRWFHDITLLGYLALFTSGIALLFKNIEMYCNIKILKKIALIIFIPVIYVLIITINKAAVLAQMTEEAGLSFITRLQTKVESIEGYGDLPDLKKYFIINNFNVEYFPYNKDLYPYSIGVTTSFILNEKDMVDALRVLGINATTASDKMDKQIRKEIFKILDNRDKDMDSMRCYPDPDAMFIYKNIIVISMCQFN
jgi:hypothetical protein